MKVSRKSVSLVAIACSLSSCNAGVAPDDPRELRFEAAYEVDNELVIPGANFGNLYFSKGEGTPVVFYYPADQGWWQWQIEDLSADYRAIAVSEDTSVPPGDSLVDPSHLIDALENLREEIGVERINLVTHSVSARIAMELAIRRPDLLNLLVLEEPAWAPTPDMEGPLPPPEPVPCGLELDNLLDRGLCDFLSMQMGPGRFEALPETMREFFFAGNREQVEAVLAALPPGVEAGPIEPLQLDVICDDLGALDFPILFVRGADTPAMFAAGMDYYEECLPQHETVVVPDATHMVHFEQPEAYNAALRSFLEKHLD